MRPTASVLIALGLSACSSGGLIDQVGDDTGDTEYVDTGDTDAEVTESEACHPADPLDLAAGWTRSYAVTWQGNAGTEVQSGMGVGSSSTGAATYLVKSALTATNGDTLNTLEHRSCDATGRAVLHETASTGQASIELIPGFPIPLPVDAKTFNSTPEPYLTGLAILEGTGTWSYSYDLMTVNTGGAGGFDLSFQLPNCRSGLNPDVPDNDAMCVPVSGTVTAMGVQTITVPAGTFEAYYVINERTETWSEASSGMGSELDILLELIGDSFPMPGLFGSDEDVKTIQQVWYVEGIGLVKELTALQSDPTNPILVRELTGHTVPASQ